MSNQSNNTSKDSTEIETEEEWYDEYGERLPDLSRRRFLQGTGATGLAAATHGASNHPAVRDFSDHGGEAEALLPALPIGAGAASKALGLAGIVGGGVTIAESAGFNILDSAGEAVSSTIDTAFGFLPDDDSSAVDEGDTLATAHIMISGGFENIQAYSSNVLTGTQNQIRLSKDTATSEGLKNGVQRLDQGISTSQAQAQAEIGVQKYYLRLQKAMLEDWNAIFHRNQGIYDAFELENKLGEDLLGLKIGGSTDDVTVDYATATENMDTVPDKWDQDEEGRLVFKYELLDGSTLKAPAAVTTDGSSEFTPVPSDQQAPLVFKDQDGNNISIQSENWEQVWKEIVNAEQSTRDLVSKAVQDAAQADLSTQELISVLDASEINTRLEDGEDASALQTAHASLYGDTQTDPANTDVELEDSDKDGKLTVETESGGEKAVDSSQGNVVYTSDDDVPTDSNGNRRIEQGKEYTAGDGTYFVDDKGRVRKVAQGQNVEPSRIVERTENENGEVVEQEVQSTGVQNTEFEESQAEEVRSNIDTIEESQESTQELIDELESDSGGGGGFFDDGGGLGLGLVGGLLAAIYLFQSQGNNSAPNRSNRSNRDRGDN